MLKQFLAKVECIDIIRLPFSVSSRWLKIPELIFHPWYFICIRFCIHWFWNCHRMQWVGSISSPHCEDEMKNKWRIWLYSLERMQTVFSLFFEMFDILFLVFCLFIGICVIPGILCFTGSKTTVSPLSNSLSYKQLPDPNKILAGKCGVIPRATFRMNRAQTFSTEFHFSINNLETNWRTQTNNAILNILREHDHYYHNKLFNSDQ